MIHEAEPTDQAAIQRLYQLLIPNGPVKVLPERIEQIKNEAAHRFFEKNGFTAPIKKDSSNI